MTLNVRIRDCYKQEFWDDLDRSLGLEGGFRNVIDEKEHKWIGDPDTRIACRNIANSMIGNAPKISQGLVQNLSENCGKKIREKWKEIIDMAKEAGIADRIPQLDNAYTNVRSWDRFLKCLRGYKDGKGIHSQDLEDEMIAETKTVIRELDLFPEWFGDFQEDTGDDRVFTELISSKIPPFGEFMGSTRPSATWRMYRNSLHYIVDTVECESTQRGRFRSALTEFFLDPGMGRVDSEVGNEVSKVIGFCSHPRRAETGIFDKLCREADQTNSDRQSRREDIERRLQAFDSHEWIDPKKKMVDLCKFASRGGVIEVVGEGGLGKTALCNEFIRLNLEEKTGFDRTGLDRVEVAPYDYYILLSSKKWELATTNVVGDRGYLNLAGDPSQALTDYLDEGDFENFLNRLNRLPGGSSGVAGAYEVLENNRVLVLIDNFEDVVYSHRQSEKQGITDTNWGKYRDFFDNLPRMESVIFVTAREMSLSPHIVLPAITMEVVDIGVGIDILKSRFTWLAQRPDETDFRLHVDALSALLELDKQVFDEIITSVGEQFKQNLGFPVIILYYTLTLGLTSDERVTDPKILLQRAAVDGNLKQKIENVEDWTTERAYDLLLGIPHCEEVLKNLYHNEMVMRSADDIQLDVDLSNNEFNRAWIKLQGYSLLLETEGSGSERRYRMSPPGVRVLGKMRLDGLERREGSDEEWNPTLEKPISELNEAIAGSDEVTIQDKLEEVVKRLENPEYILEEATKDDLVSLCKSRGLPHSKDKHDLIVSLKENVFRNEVSPRVIQGLTGSLTSLERPIQGVDEELVDRYQKVVLDCIKKALGGNNA